ncbi:MAG: hypothetical protein ACI8O8_003025 [Oleiphilaceae bacterium]|jgi:hypothetical protein
MRFGLGFLILSSIFILTACTSGPSEDEFTPEIGDIQTAIVHSHPSAHAQTDYQRTIDIVVRVTVTDPDGWDDITDIYIHDKNDDTKWKLKEASQLNLNADCKKTLSVIECSFYSRDQPDTLQLLGYEMVAVDRNGYSSSKVFEFKLPSGAEVEDQEFVYSDVFSGGTNNGIAGLEVMTIADNDMVFSLDEVELHVEFTSEDPRIREYALELYDDATPPKFIGEVAFDTIVIQANEISSGVQTLVNIPLSQINFIDGNIASNIFGLHIVLFDQSTVSTQLEVQSEWFNYRGYSDFITLAP